VALGRVRRGHLVTVWTESEIVSLFVGAAPCSCCWRAAGVRMPGPGAAFRLEPLPGGLLCGEDGRL
jgi:hypothetical protein